MRIISRLFVGAWLSLVEHSVWDAGVGGSNPSAPTISSHSSSYASSSDSHLNLETFFFALRLHNYGLGLITRAQNARFAVSFSIYIWEIGVVTTCVMSGGTLCVVRARISHVKYGWTMSRT